MHGKKINPPQGSNIAATIPITKLLKWWRKASRRNYPSSLHASARTLFQKSQLMLIENYLGD
jgi:hypothetical protein